MSPDADDIHDRLTERLREEDRLHTAWLCGSSARDEAGPESDLDLAVWADEPLSLDDRLRLSATLQEAVDEVELDVVYLNDAHPVLRYEVVRDGRRLSPGTPARPMPSNTVPM